MQVFLISLLYTLVFVKNMISSKCFCSGVETSPLLHFSPDHRTEEVHSFAGSGSDGSCSDDSTYSDSNEPTDEVPEEKSHASSPVDSCTSQLEHIQQVQIDIY